MNRLKYSRCYLAGSMEKDHGRGMEWRMYVKQQLSDLEICWLDPTNKPTTIAYETDDTIRDLLKSRAEGDFDTVMRLMKLVRCVDLRMTDISDFLIVNIDPDMPTFGTHEEIANANRQKKPIIMRIEGGKTVTPLWLLGMLPHQMIFSEWDEIWAYLRHIAHDPIIDRLNRWYFFTL